MLTPEYLENCTDDIIELFSKLDESITKDIVRRIVKTNIVTEGAALQTTRLQESGKLYDEILKEASSMTGKSVTELKRLFKEAGVESVKYDSSVYKKAGLDPLPLNLAPESIKRLTAGIKKTNGLITNLTKTTAISAQRAYINACTLAEMQVESGAFDYITAIRNAVNSAIEQGATVVYPSGHTDKLDVAIRRSVLTGVSQTTGEISEAYANDMGCDLMEITAHFGARPSHAEWQGKIVSLSGKKGYLSKADIGYGTGAGFKGWNCRHDWYPFFKGISERKYSEERLDELNEKKVEYEGKKFTEYEAQQHQRAMERRIRKTRRELSGYDEAMKAADNDELKSAFKTDFDRKSVLLKKQESAYKDFCNKTSRYQQKERLQVKGFGRSVSQKAVQANKKVQIGNNFNESIANIEKNDILQSEISKFKKVAKKHSSSNRQYLQIISDKFSNGPEIAQKVFNKFVRRSSVADSSYSGTPHFSITDKKVHFSILNDLNNPKGAGVTFFHEYGHYIDFYSAGKNNKLFTSTQNLQFENALRDDFKNYVQNYMKSNGINQTEAFTQISQTLAGAKHSAISDLFGGLSQNKCAGRTSISYGHKTSYWNNKGALSKEAFAHMFEAEFDFDRYELIKTYFPTALQEFDNIMKGMI